MRIAALDDETPHLACFATRWKVWAMNVTCSAMAWLCGARCTSKFANAGGQCGGSVKIDSAKGVGCVLSTARPSKGSTQWSAGARTIGQKISEKE